MSFQDRQNEIIRKVAVLAERQPLLGSGLWFHHDVRDNFYYASYLFAAAVNEPDRLPFEAEGAKKKAEAVLLEVLQLQDQNPNSETYGYWPLNLEPAPRQAKPHELPVELMGSLMAFFAATYKIHFDKTLTAAFDAALTHIYRSGFYRVPLNHFNHHEAKFTAAKLIFGQLFDDTALFEDGQSSLQRTLTRIQKQGMSEYGCLPWFWHWVQAYTCAWHMTEDASTKKTLGEMLDFLWNERAAFYLKGTWVGTHSRGLRHDIPLDGNVLHDYVQFGDFKLPEEMPRTEYAGFLYYAAPETGRHTALNRNEPAEVKKTITKQAGGDTFKLHSYAYITADFAAGGMWERYEEFDNEQHRWDITLPLGRQAGINQGYFFHPSDENSHNDPRHQTGHTEVLYHKNTIIALYPIPEDVPNQIVGVLPKTDWQQEQNVLLGQTGDIYWAVYLMQPYQAELQNDRCIVTSEGSRNGVVMEVMSSKTAEGLGLASFEAFAAEARRNHPVWPSDESFSVQYTTLEQTQLRISTGRHGNPDKRINEQPIDFTGYSI